MKLRKESYEWAINHLFKYSDTDIFPRLIEIDILFENIQSISEELAEKDIETLEIGYSRRIIIPKDDISYRIGTQLSFMDNIILTAIIYEYGQLIENNRIPRTENVVFSYRFKPNQDFQLYDDYQAWNKFWEFGYGKSEKFTHFLFLDISDYYNQIYHHTIENSLIEYDFPNQIKKWILSLLEKVTVKVSRGIPIGSHAIHLLSEAILSKIDNSLKDRGITFIRFVDDFIVFCKSDIEARKINLMFAEILDKQGRLVTQKQKTRILNSSDFQDECRKNYEDRPINDLEDKLLKVIKRHSGGNPYATVSLNDLSSEEIREFSIEIVEKILKDYVENSEIDFIRLRWFLRRLSQVGHPAGLKYLLEKIVRILPALNDIFRYILSIDKSDLINWVEIGELLISLSNSELTKDVQYYQLISYSIFNRKVELNHLSHFINLFKKVSPEIQREILLIGFKNNSKDWLREQKESFNSFDPWNRYAFIIASSILPKDERKFFLNNNINKETLSEKFLSEWSLKQ